MHLSQNKDYIYNKKNLDNEKSKNINKNLNEDKTSIVALNALLINQKDDAIAQTI